MLFCLLLSLLNPGFDSLWIYFVQGQFSNESKQSPIRPRGILMPKETLELFVLS
jgi:hypothetical protein